MDSICPKEVEADTFGNVLIAKLCQNLIALGMD